MKNSNKILTVIFLVAAAASCSERSSTLKSFKAAGAATKIETAALPQALQDVFANPDLCAEKMHPGKMAMWAGYSANQVEWGQAEADCTTKGSEIFCVEDEGYLARRKSIMGIDLPRIYGLKANAGYACLRAAQAVGMQAATDRSRTHGNQVTLERVAEIDSDIASTERSEKDTYVVTAVSTNKATNLSLTVKYFFTAHGEVFGISNRQQQKFNAETRVQTAEVHFPSARAGSLKEPSSDSALAN